MKSINADRLSNNVLEQKFVDAWAKANANNRLLKYILDRTHQNRGDHRVTQTEEEIVVTIVQWLGTPVGQGFLQDIIEE